MRQPLSLRYSGTLGSLIDRIIAQPIDPLMIILAVIGCFGLFHCLHLKVARKHPTIFDRANPSTKTEINDLCLRFALSGFGEFPVANASANLGSRCLASTTSLLEHYSFISFSVSRSGHLVVFY